MKILDKIRKISEYFHKFVEIIETLKSCKDCDDPRKATSQQMIEMYKQYIDPDNAQYGKLLVL